MEHAISAEIAQLKERINESINSLEAKYVELGLEMETLRQIRNDEDLYDLLDYHQMSLDYRIQLTTKYMYSIVKNISILKGTKTPEEINFMDDILFKALEAQKEEDERVRLSHIQNEEEGIRQERFAKILNEGDSKMTIILRGNPNSRA